LGEIATEAESESADDGVLVAVVGVVVENAITLSKKDAMQQKPRTTIVIAAIRKPLLDRQPVFRRMEIDRIFDAIRKLYRLLID
jgi:hypothetical protein